MGTKASQAKQILAYIEKNGSITDAEAARNIKPPCYRLSGRIHDLRKMGYPVVTEYKTNIDGIRYGVYKLEEKRHGWTNNREDTTK